MKIRSGVGLGANLVPLILIIILILGGISSLALAGEEKADDGEIKGDNVDSQEGDPSTYSVKTDPAFMWALVIFVISMIIYCFIVKMDLGI